MRSTYDLVVIGGGINGAAIARDAAGRGLKVYLAEKNDYASATSSASSKLIHGGIRYLEHFEFRLVRESLRERETLLRIAPHLVRPLRFLLPVTHSQPRPVWMVHLGLLLYDTLAGRGTLARTGRLHRREQAQIVELDGSAVRGIVHYPDCFADDSRLVLSTLLDARARGATIANRCEVKTIQPRQHDFVIELAGRGGPRTVETRALVNAAGPWADRILARVTAGSRKPIRLKLVRGSHLVMRAPEHARPEAYTLQNPDGRVLFVIPWLQGRYRIIGTTDVVHDGEPDAVTCSDEERAYMIESYNRFFRTKIAQNDIVWEWSGVRPLVDDGSGNPSRITRDYTFDFARFGDAAMLTVLGGKLTTHRLLAERALQMLSPLFDDITQSWTATAPLQGGVMSLEQLDCLSRSAPPLISAATRARWVNTYGSDTQMLYERLAREPETAREVVAGIHEAELMHAVEHEGAQAAEDFLYRRTKIFIDLDSREREGIYQWFAQNR